MRTIPVTFVLGVSLFLGSCDDGIPVVISQSRSVSPDGRNDLVVEKVDNSLGFGQGLVYYEVHVVGHLRVVPDHGNKSRSCVFYVAEETDSDIPTLAGWIAPDQIVITYDGRRNPGKSESSIGLILVQYRATWGGATSAATL
jgi:hypothetical protein